MSRLGVWEELKQIFGPDFKLARRFIIIDYMLMLLLALITLIYYFFPMDFDAFYLFLPFFLIARGINYYREKKINLNKRFKGSRYEKRVERPIRVLFAVFLLTVIVLGFFKIDEEFKTQPIQKAIENFGYHVNAPTYIPFKPTKQYGWIDQELNQLEISYQKGFSTQLVIYVTPKKPNYYNKKGEIIPLLGNSTGFYSVSESGDSRLDWERDGLYYSLDYVSQNPPTKSEMLKIVNSMN
ncbi:hypothetical protein WQ54_16475 [Bacillus sp. SA1-12]|uniref:hypothetical protein n=1 Tax=Bacillus sp. SA1-12 TaxID=1455638 RepID=UPI00062704A8|nr:hypothetical protein [Bacillus sp. SA1-12]KKI91138.1 hypothetical protein WQ54_16475 [Bacillus sp. SA1-12]